MYVFVVFSLAHTYWGVQWITFTDETIFLIDVENKAWLCSTSDLKTLEVVF